MDIKKGDNVIVLTGKDRSKKGKVLNVADGRVVVEGLNMFKKHQKARKQGQKGQIISKEHPLDRSNVQIICGKCGKPTRISHQIISENKIRVCKKCGAEL